MDYAVMYDSGSSGFALAFRIDGWREQLLGLSDVA
jgi:hypothetical protein